MATFIGVFVVFVLVFLGMSVGVIFKRPPIAGSCGGLNNLNSGDDGSCQICGATVNEKCQKEIKDVARS